MKHATICGINGGAIRIIFSWDPVTSFRLYLNGFIVGKERYRNYFELMVRIFNL
jgi:hypothetical protein